MKSKVGGLQPRAIWGTEKWHITADAARLANKVAIQGAVLITFQVGYPRASHEPMDSVGKMDQTPKELL